MHSGISPIVSIILLRAKQERIKNKDKIR